MTGAHELHGARRLSALRAVPGFDALDTDEVAALAAVAEETFVARGALLVRRGEPATRTFIILDGQARASRTLVGPRTVVGGLEMLAGVPIALDVRAETDVLALALRRDHVLDFFEESYAATVGGLRALAGQVLGELRRRDLGHRPFPAPARPPLPRPGGPLSLADKLLHLHAGLTLGLSRLEALGNLAQIAVEERRERGAVMWRAGEPAAAGWSIVAGEVECRRPGRAPYRVAAPLDIGVLEAHAGAPRWYDAVAATDLIALRLDVADVLDVVEDHVDLAHDILRSMAGALLRLGTLS
jgi:CRP-like cAMP-binding protein